MIGIQLKIRKERKYKTNCFDNPLIIRTLLISESKQDRC